MLRAWQARRCARGGAPTSSSARLNSGDGAHDVGQDDAGDPLGAAAGVVAEPRLEVGRGERAHVGEDAVEVGEGEPRQDLLGLVLDHELERAVMFEVLRRCGDAGDERVFERVDALHRFVQRQEEPVEFVGRNQVQQVLFAAGHDPVDGGPAEAGLAGHVVEGGLGEAPAGDATKRGGDDAGLRIVFGAQIR